MSNACTSSEGIAPSSESAVQPPEATTSAARGSRRSRSMIARSMMPLAMLLAGPLADRVFEPLLRPGGAWADTWLGVWLGVGAGRGMGLMFIAAGALLLAATAAAALNPRLRNVEADLPDAVQPAPAEAARGPEAVPAAA